MLVICNFFRPHAPGAIETEFIQCECSEIWMHLVAHFVLHVKDHGFWIQNVELRLDR